MALLLQQHGAGRAGRYQATGTIQHGRCDILEVTAETNTILHVAAEQGHDELIRELYVRFREEGLLSRRNSALDTPLHCAARAGHAKAVTVLVQLGQDCGESIWDARTRPATRPCTWPQGAGMAWWWRSWSRPQRPS